MIISSVSFSIFMLLVIWLINRLCGLNYFLSILIFVRIGVVLVILILSSLLMKGKVALSLALVLWSSIILLIRVNILTFLLLGKSSLSLALILREVKLIDFCSHLSGFFNSIIFLKGV
ncbi:hypothetical protein POUND7_003979 [Theobroma cacao]